jgi:hypothetical protein
MDHEERSFAMVQGLVPKPIDQVQPVVGSQYVVDRIFGAKRRYPFRSCKEKEVVVAEHDACGRTERTDVAKHTEGIRPAIDQIPNKPKTVAAWIKTDMIQKTLQGIVASLHIADCISRHKKETSTVISHSEKRNGGLTGVSA